jgi:hypothetical protein
MSTATSSWGNPIGRVDVVAQDRLAGVNVAGYGALDRFTQQSFAKLGITLNASLDGLF